MSDREFDVLDELYFVTHFEELRKVTGLSSDDLWQTLVGLRKKGWLKIYKTVSEELSKIDLEAANDYQTYYYLASKEGLLAHNGR